MSAIPWIGQDLVEFIWGGFSINNATLNRFFALHFVLPFVLAALALMHLIALHDTAGANNPTGLSADYDRLSFAPYYLFKDLITIFIFIFVLSTFVFLMPNALGDSDNYIMGNPMQTPSSIVPEWYLLPFYAILRSIPNKLLGVIAMLAAILILLAMPYTDLGRSRGIQFRPLSKIAFYVFIANFFILMVIGAKHVESPYIELGQISTIIYFSYFLILVPFISLLENSLVELSSFNTVNKLAYNFNKSSSLNSSLYTGRRNFHSTARCCMDSSSDEGENNDNESEEDVEMEEDLFESEIIRSQLQEQKEEYEKVQNKSTEEKVDYVQNIVNHHPVHEGSTVTPETVDGVLTELIDETDVHIVSVQKEIDDIYEQKGKPSRNN